MAILHAGYTGAPEKKKRAYYLLDNGRRGGTYKEKRV